MIECHLTERLTESGCPKIGLETIRVKDRDERFDSVEWGTRFGIVPSDMTATSGKNSVHRSDAVGWCLHFHVINGLQEARSGLPQLID